MCNEVKCKYSVPPSLYFRAFINCTQTAISTPRGWHQNLSYCSSNFDGIGCWNATLPHTIVTIGCPHYIPGSKPLKNATRKCRSDGQWQYNNGKYVGDYSECHFDANIQTLNGTQLIDLLEVIVKHNPSPYSDVNTANAFDDCIDRVLVGPKLNNPDLLYCPRTFDGWSCFNDTLAGRVAVIGCPEFINGFEPNRKVRKTCMENGEWYKHYQINKTWSNYTDCVDWDYIEFYQSVNNIFITGSSISLGALIISFTIFCSFKSLSSQTRVRIHKNLFISFMNDNFVWIIYYIYVVSEPNVLKSNPIWCQAIYVVVHYFMVCNYFWMFCEVLYLHNLLVVSFVTDKKLLNWFCMIGWCVPIPLIIIYTLLRHRSSDPIDTRYCWVEDGTYNQLLTGPMSFSLLCNFFILINVVRVLVRKLRADNTSVTIHTRKAIWKTIILIPLLGLQFILTPFRPETRTTAEKVYEIVSAIVTSLQGLSVSLVFCFFNGEVVAIVRKKWRQTVLRHGLSRDTRGQYAATTVSFAAEDHSTN